MSIANINKEKLCYERSKGCQIFYEKGDRLKPFQGKKFDCIFSNPPYIKEDLDRAMVHSQVIKHEPHEALFLKDDLYDDWFISLFQDVDQMLNENGAFFMEGHECHLNHLKNLAEKKTLRNVELISDLSSRLRVLKMS